MTPDDDVELAAAHTVEAQTVGDLPSARRPAAVARGGSIGRYIVIDRIGEGGMGVVHSAFDPELGRRVAIKLVATGKGSAAGEGRQRLLREAQAMAQVSHPNVIAVYDAGTVGDDVFIAMELRAGKTLADWLKEERRGWREVLAIFVQAGRGLEAAHRAGLVHRDFKPENVHVGDDGRVCVLDFGLARPAGIGGPSASDDGSPVASTRPLDTPLTQAGALVGTPQYMAPEQHAGEATDGRTDQFGFCVALYEGLYGERPFRGTTFAELGEAVRAGKIDAPKRDHDVPGWLRAALLRGLSTKSADRFPSMTELLATLDRQAVRRRGTALVAAGVLVLGAAGLIATRGGGAPAKPPPCRGAGDKLATTWSPARKDALRERFAASGLPFAADTADRAIAVLDGWAGRWVTARIDSCEATQVRGEQSEEVLALALQCLDRRQQELDALVGVLEHADAKVVEEAVAATGKLADADDCRDARSLTEPARPPAGSAAAVEAIGKDLAEGKAQHSAGHYEDAQRAADAAVEAADRLGHRPLQAEADLLAAKVAQARSDGERAEHLYDAGLLAAIEGRTDELAARIAIDRASLIGIERARPADGLVAAQLADALIGRLGRPDLLTADLDVAIGAINRVQGNAAEAQTRLERALALVERDLGRDAPETGKVCNQLGILAYNQGRYADAAEWFDRVRASREHQLGPDHPSLGGVLVNVGVARMHLGRYPEASQAFARALAILEPKLGPDHITLVKLHNNLGMLEAKQGRYQAAIERHQRALDMHQRLPGATDVDAAATMINLALAERHLGRLADAIAMDRKVIAIYEKAYGKKHPDLFYPLTELGEALIGQKKWDEAIAALRRGRAMRAGQEEDASERAEGELALAVALWESGRDRAEAVRQATLARDDYAAAEKVNPTFATERAEAETWLSTHSQ